MQGLKDIISSIIVSKSQLKIRTKNFALATNRPIKFLFFKPEKQVRHLIRTVRSVWSSLA